MYVHYVGVETEGKNYIKSGKSMKKIKKETIKKENTQTNKNKRKTKKKQDTK